MVQEMNESMNLLTKISYQFKNEIMDRDNNNLFAFPWNILFKSQKEMKSSKQNLQSLRNKN